MADIKTVLNDEIYKRSLLLYLQHQLEIKSNENECFSILLKNIDMDRILYEYSWDECYEDDDYVNEFDIMQVLKYIYFKYEKLTSIEAIPEQSRRTTITDIFCECDTKSTIPSKLKDMKVVNNLNNKIYGLIIDGVIFQLVCINFMVGTYKMERIILTNDNKVEFDVSYKEFINLKCS